MLLDASTHRAVETLRVQALELGLRRAGMHTVLLRSTLPQCRVMSASGRVGPMALVICGGELQNGTVERLMQAVRQADCSAPLYGVGETSPDTKAISPLGPCSVEATRAMP